MWIFIKLANFMKLFANATRGWAGKYNNFFYDVGLPIFSFAGFYAGGMCVGGGIMSSCSPSHNVNNELVISIVIG